MIREFDGLIPKIDPSVFVSEAAYIIGDVEIGPESSVWPGAVIRGDCGKITIGRNTCIEDNCVVHGYGDLAIGNSVIVGHGVVLHCSKVGDYILIGNNATVLNHAEIGDYSIIGAGSTVAEGMKIPQRSMCVGTPARIKGQVSSEWIEQIKDGAAFYTDLASKYRQQNL